MSRATLYGGYTSWRLPRMGLRKRKPPAQYAALAHWQTWGLEKRRLWQYAEYGYVMGEDALRRQWVQWGGKGRYSFVWRGFRGMHGRNFDHVVRALRTRLVKEGLRTYV